MPKRVLPLTELQISKAKGKEKEYTLFDGNGLFLLVTPTGGKLWRYKYRLGGKEKKLSLGTYPELSLSDARDKRQEAKRLLARGLDPVVIKDNYRSDESAADSFETIAREWHCKYSGEWVAHYAALKLARLEKNVFPWIGSAGIMALTAPDLLTVLRRVEDRGALDIAHRILLDFGKIFRYAIATGKATRDTSADLRGALPPVRNGHRAAPTRPADLAPLVSAIDGYTGSYVVRAGLRLLPMLFVRPGELRHMEWTELDLDAAEWDIPAGKMKMKNPHLVPLPCQAVKILKDLQPLTGRSKYVFPGGRSYLIPLSENAFNAALRNMGFEKDVITGHGFRATARTILDEVLHFRPDIIEHQLAHAVKDPNGRAYNRTEHLEYRKNMMQVWADYLDGLKG